MSERIIGVLADTHIPDRRRRLHPQIAEIFRAAKVEMILHAGDISIPSVLRELEKIAPVQAVRGNRDLFWSEELPIYRVLDIEGKKIGITHGHGSFSQYVGDKIRYLMGHIPKFRYYAERAQDSLPNDVDAIIFGHNHAAMLEWRAGKLFFNPGSACCHVFKDKGTSVGLLRVTAEKIMGEIIFLEKE
jgi:putative phosphoesterase